MGLRTWLTIYDDVLRQRWHVRHLRGLRAEDLCDDVAGRTFIVTGPTSGIGTEIAAALARKGAHVVLACRSTGRGEELAASFRAEAAAAGAPAPSLEVAALDLSSLDSVRAFAAAWEKRADGRPLGALVNNAGIFDMGSSKPGRDDRGHEAHWGTNYLAPTLLTLLMLPALTREAAAAADAGKPPPRVVFVSSIMHLVGALDLNDPDYTGSRKYSATDAYASSKLAGVTLAKELERRFAASGGPLASVRCLSVHPGNVLTGVVRTLPRAVQIAYRVVMGAILLSAPEGARAPVLCAAGAAPARAPRPGPYFGSGGREEAPNPAAHDEAAQQALWAHTLRTLELNEAQLGLAKR